jgi:hypothetical protein
MESDTKLKELSLYVAEKSKEDPSFGATKLNKILFIADFHFYGLTGKAITEAEYVHRDKGPAPRRMPIILENLEAEGRAIIEERSSWGYKQKRLVPLKGPDTSSFSGDELSFVDAVITFFSSYNATDLSLWTHKLTNWLSTTEGEAIPYPSVFLMYDLPVEKAGIDWAREELKRLQATAG